MVSIMKSTRVLLLVAATALSATLQAGVTLEYDREGFVRACLESGSLSRAVCECASEKAARELSPVGFEFLISTLEKDRQRSTELRRKMEQKELQAAGRFMSHGPDECARELGEKAG